MSECQATAAEPPLSAHRSTAALALACGSRINATSSKTSVSISAFNAGDSTRMARRRWTLVRCGAHAARRTRGQPRRHGTQLAEPSILIDQRRAGAQVLPPVNAGRIRSGPTPWFGARVPPTARVHIGVKGDGDADFIVAMGLSMYLSCCGTYGQAAPGLRCAAAQRSRDGATVWSSQERQRVRRRFASTVRPPARRSGPAAPAYRRRRGAGWPGAACALFNSVEVGFEVVDDGAGLRRFRRWLLVRRGRKLHRREALGRKVRNAGGDVRGANRATMQIRAKHRKRERRLDAWVRSEAQQRLLIAAAGNLIAVHGWAANQLGTLALVQQEIAELERIRLELGRSEVHRLHV